MCASLFRKQRASQGNKAKIIIKNVQNDDVQKIKVEEDYAEEEEKGTL